MVSLAGRAIDKRDIQHCKTLDEQIPRVFWIGSSALVLFNVATSVIEADCSKSFFQEVLVFMFVT